MRVVTYIAAGMFALTASSALAQTAGSGPGAPPLSTAPSAGASAAPKAPAVNPFTDEDVSQINGTDVYGSDGKKIGTISTVLMKPESKTIDRLVVSAGGVLGVGAHHVAMPIDQFKWDGSKDGFVISKNADDLKSMAEWQDPARATTSGVGSSTPPAR
jgi:sporulation protein YlmC with PRC-barrel domain